MSASTKSGFWAGFSRFFSLKSDQQLSVDARDSRHRASTLAAPHGLRGFIVAEQQKVDTLVSNTSKFLADIEKHFGHLAKFLGEEYDGRSKFKNIETGYARRFAMKWEDGNGSEEENELAFVYTEYENGVRIDYIGKSGADFEEVITDDWDGASEEVKVWRSRASNSFRTVFRFADHNQFVQKGVVPTWFADMLTTRIPRI